MSATNVLPKQSGNLINCEDIVEKENFYIELKNFYKKRKNCTRPEWTSERIKYIIGLLELYKEARMQNKAVTSQKYHYFRKYDVISIENEKSLIKKEKDCTSPVIRIVASEEYYNHLMLTHVSTGHGGRDKILSTLKNQYYIPAPAINIFTKMCKVCLCKKNGLKADIVFRPVVLAAYEGSCEQVSDTNEEASQVSHEEKKEVQLCDDLELVPIGDSSDNLRNLSNYESSRNPTPNKKQKTHADVHSYAELTRNPATDDCSIFAEYIAKEMRKIKDDTILAMAKHQITNVIFESQMKYFESTKSKPVSESPSPGGSRNYNSEKGIRTSIELVPIKVEVD